MTDEWAIASLSQAIEGEDDDDVLIPPTPGQEDIDMTTQSQDSTSLLGSLADSQAAGRRKMHTLSLGLPDDPESESLPFLALEWDSQFPPTPAPENGQSADNYLAKEKEDNLNNKNRLSKESCNGQSTVWEGCSTSWLTKEAEASGIRTATGGSGEEDNTSKNKEKDQIGGTNREEKNVDDKGGGRGAKAGRGDGGGGEDREDGEGDGDDNEDSKKKKKETKEEEEEESSHEPSSDSSEGLLSLSESQKKDETEKAGTGDAASFVVPKFSQGDEELSITASVKTGMELGESEAGSSQRDLFPSQIDQGEAVEQLQQPDNKKSGESEVGSSQRDLFSSQVDQGEDVEQIRHPDDKQSGERKDPVALSPASSMPILHLSQPEDAEEMPSSPEKLSPDTPSDVTPMVSATTPTHFSSLPHLTPPKRKLSEDEDNEGDSSEIPFKQPRKEDFSGSSESGEDKVFVDYSTLTKKDVEISPKQQKLPPRNLKPPHLSSAAKRITFNLGDASSSIAEKNVVFHKQHSEEMSEDIELPSLSPVDTEEEGIGMSEPPRRLPVDTEEESSDNNERNVKQIISTVSKEVHDTKDVSDKEDSDIEIIEDKNRSIEVLYEKPKPKSSYDGDDGSQNFSLTLSGTQQESPYSDEHGKRFSEEHKFSEESVPESQSQSLIPMSDAEDLKCHGTLSSSSDEGSREHSQDPTNTMPATQMEEICLPAVITQPDIEPLIMLPISRSSGSTSKTAETEVPTVDVKDDDHDIERQLSNQESQSTQPDVSTRKSVIKSQSCDEQSQPSKSETKLQMPDILTPSTQDLIVVCESESVFVKAANAAKERVQQEEKRVEEKKLEENSSVVRSDSSFECMEVSKIKVGEQITSDESRVEVTSSESTPVLGLKPSLSSQSTSISSQLQRTNLFGLNKKENASSTRVLAEETDSEDEGRALRKRKKLRTKSASQSYELETKSISTVKKDIIKTSTPNTSQGISPNLSGVGGSDIDKDPPGASVITETSNSNSATPEQLKSFKDSESVETTGIRTSSQDTEVLSVTDSTLSFDDLIKAGFRKKNMYLQAVEFKHPYTNKSYYITIDQIVSNDNNYVIYEKEGASTKVSLQRISELGSSSSNVRAGRISDVSLLSRISSSSGSGYLGDKSSSSGASQRLSIISTESSRLSLASVVTLPSPPHERKDKESDLQKSQGDEDNFRAPTGRAKSGKSGATLPNVITIDATSPTRKITPNRKQYKSPPNSSTTSGDELPDLSEKRSRGRGRSKGQGSRSTPSEQSPGRGRGRGRGKSRGRGKVHNFPSKAESELSDNEYEKSSKISTVKPLPTTASKMNTQSLEEVVASEGRLIEHVTSIPEILKSMPENVWKLLENSQVPLSEEEEEIFVLQGGADEERQLAQVLKRVREVDLKPGLLVFARFTDNNFYSAILKEQDGSDRWYVQFTLDQHTASVREVYLLPTDLLPRGHPCFVRHQTEQFSDPGVVKGHMRVDSTLLHIIETDRGVTKRIAHSHMFLTGQQAHELLQARLNFRSMVASPGRDVSLDNIMPGRRRRTPNKQLSRTLKVDDNLDSSESTVGELEDMITPLIHSPSSRKIASRVRKVAKRQDLSVLPEENEMESEQPSTPGTPRGRKRPSTTKLLRTPKTPKASHNIEEPEASTSAVAPESQVLSSIVEDSHHLQITELQKEQTPQTPPKKRGRPPAGQSSSTQTPQKFIKSDEVNPQDPRLGPLPSEGSQLFAGFVVLMTSGESSIRKRQSPDDEDLPPFDRDYMAEQFSRGGGKVIEKYSEAEIIMAEQGKPVITKQTPSKSKKKNTSTSTSTTVLLIANTHCRTSKFIQCLAAGVPIVSFQWIIDSSAQNKCDDWRTYLLPAGENESLETVEQNLIFEEGFQSGPPQVLVGERVFLATSTNKEFNSLWQRILNTAGADVRHKPAKTGNLNRVLVKAMTVVVADATIPEKELQRANQLGIPVVKTEWVIQSLIAGKRLGYRDNAKFMYDSNSVPSKPEEK